jgi:hypothetical protein
MTPAFVMPRLKAMLRRGFHPRRRVPMRHLLAALSLVLTASVAAQDDWVEIGADTQARYYVNIQSIEVEGETIRLQKRAVYNSPLVDNFTGRQVLFKESIGVVELDCGRHVNRVISMEMIGVDGEVVWSSGKMDKRLWEDVRPNTHGEATFVYVCKHVNKS